MTQPSSSERVLHIDRPASHTTLLRADNGEFLAIADGATPTTLANVDDRAIWIAGEQADVLRHVVTGVQLKKFSSGHGATCKLEFEGSLITHNGVSNGEPASFSLEHGPAELPSKSLQQFKRDGWVCLPAIVDPATVAALQRVACVGDWSSSAFDHHTPILNQSCAVARATAEPVSLWLIRQYLRTDDIRMAHSPSMAVLEPDDGVRDVQGWHCDYPYLWGSPRAIGGDRVPSSASCGFALGVQRNFCVTEFTQANGATRFKLGSHTLNRAPEQSWGVDATYCQPGYRKANGLPYSGDEADVIEAPAGSIILYDARTWHCAGTNRTDHKRAAILHAMTPMFIMPFKDTSASYMAFASGKLAQALTERERREVERLLVHAIVGPFGRHAIGIDQALSELAAGTLERTPSGSR